MENLLRSQWKPAAKLHNKTNRTPHPIEVVPMTESLRKKDGPRVRANPALITLLENACAEIHTAPNSGTPEFLKGGLKVWAESFDESAVRRAVRKTAAKHKISEQAVIDLFSKVVFSIE